MPRSRTRLLAALALTLAACAKGEADWRAELDDPDPYVRGLAAIGLSLEVPEASAPALPVLFESIDRSGGGLERASAHALQLVGPLHVEVLLQELVEEELMSEDRRGAIMNALVGAGASAAGPIVRSLQGPGRGRAGDLGDLLLAIGEPAVPALVELLETSEDHALQNFAAFLLGKFGPRARAAVPALERASRSPDAGVREVARKALGSIVGGVPARTR